MGTMNISLPDDMKVFVEQEATRRGFGTVSEYVRDLIREQRDRQAERDRVDGLLLAGIDSGPATPLTRKDWDAIRREVRRRISGPAGGAIGSEGTDGP